MKNHIKISILVLSILVLSCTNKTEKKFDHLKEANQNLVAQKIYLNISNIPKIQHTVKIGMNATKTDKSPAFTYKTYNNTTTNEIKYDNKDSSLVREFDVDTIFLKLRFNPGKSMEYILRRGDSAYIHYIDKKPILSLQNRVFKQNDLRVTLGAADFESEDAPLKDIFNPFKRDQRTIQEEKNAGYDRVLITIDSLFKKELISKPEYHYFKKKYVYKKAINQNEFDTSQFKNEDLHIEAFVNYLRAFVFKNLETKTVSLGNGVARNFLGSFDFVYPKDYFSRENKKYLLKNALKNIKIDHPKSVYNDRLEKYNTLFPEDRLREDDVRNLSSIVELTKGVQLMTPKNGTTTLAHILNKNKGRIVYLDFWASWCAPCIAAFPSYKNLKKRYTEKDVVFVFVSVDNYENKWRKTSTKEKLTNNYWATNYSEAEFFDVLNLRSFPRYLLFDEEGKLIKRKAPSPDGHLLNAFLDDLIVN